MNNITEHLKSLAEACRTFLKRGSYTKECPFFITLETELVRAEDFLKNHKGNDLYEDNELADLQDTSWKHN